MLRYTIIFFLLIISNWAIGQKNWRTAYIDSLLALSEQPGCRVTDSLYMEIGHVLAYTNPVKSIDFLEKSIEISTSKGNYKVACMAHSFLGIAYGHVGICDRAVQEFQTQLSIAKEHGIGDEVVWAYSNIGHILLGLKNYEIANIYLQEAKGYMENGYGDIAQYIYINMGRLMRETGQVDSAIFYLNKTLEINTIPPIDSTKLSNSYRIIGDVYFSDMDFPKAKYYYGISTSLVDSMESDMSAPINVNLALIYMQDGANDSAYICAHQALSTALRFKNRMVLIQAYGVLGSIYYSLGKTRDAEHYYSLQIAYQDSLKSAQLSKKIYNLQYQKEILDMQDEIQLSRSNTRKVMTLCVLLVLLVIGGVVLALRYRKKDMMIKSMNLKIKEQNRQTNDSIKYAKKIQQAITPSFDTVFPFFTDKFLLFRPKQKVSGNFYWCHSAGDIEMLAIGDSGESGVPGAFMSMLGSSILHEIATNENNPASMLYLLRDRAVQIISKVNPTKQVGLGIDMSLAVFNHEDRTIDFSGIKFPMVIIHDGELFQLLDDQETNNFYTMDFTTIAVTLQDGDCLYMMTHGYPSQTNADGEQYSRERLFRYLLDIHTLPMEEQNQLLMNEFNQWRGTCSQQRDLLVMGFRYTENSTEPSTQEIQA